MQFAQLAPRLKLLGLMLISASIIMGLLLSAIGVVSVDMRTPLGKKVAREYQNLQDRLETPSAGTAQPTGATWTDYPNPQSNFPNQIPGQYSNQSQGQYQNQQTNYEMVLPPGWTNQTQYPSLGFPSDPPAPLHSENVSEGPKFRDSVQNFFTKYLGPSPSAKGQGSSPAAALSTDDNSPITVSLWMLIGTMCVAGFILWMTPLPQSNYRGYASSTQRRTSGKSSGGWLFGRRSKSSSHH